jgi:hypothetical protein
MSKKEKAGALVVGGTPRVSLLPAEINETKQARLLRRRLFSGIFLVVVIVLAAIGGATFFALESQINLDAGNEETSAILAEKAKYSEAGQIADQVELAKTARAVGTSTEIDLADYLTRIQDALPGGAKLTSVAFDSGSPISPYTQATVPLQDSRIGTFTFTVSTTSLPDLEVLMNSLVALPGYTDAFPTSVGFSKGEFTTALILHINNDALAYRYVDANGIVK